MPIKRIKDYPYKAALSGTEAVWLQDGTGVGSSKYTLISDIVALVPTGVTSVAVADAVGITWTGSPITSSGTLTPTLSVNLQGWSGIAPATKADDSAVVHLAGAESISGHKTFTYGVGGGEGGEFSIAKAVSGTSMTGDVTVDVAGDNIRIFAGNGSGLGYGGIQLSIGALNGIGTAWHSLNFDPATKLGVSAKAADSELIDGIDSTQINYGVHGNGTTSVSDMNLPTKSGFYERNPGSGVGNSANGADSWNWFMHVEHTSGGWGYQLSNIIGTDDLYFRRQETGGAGTWGSWVKIHHSGNFNPTTKQGASLLLSAIASHDGVISGNQLFVAQTNTAVDALTILPNNIPGRSSSGGLMNKPVTDDAFFALANFDEGTFTPVMVGMTTTGSGTYTQQSGNYIRVGNAVHFNLSIAWTAHTGTGIMRISGLPFTSNAAMNYPVTIGLFANLTLAANTALVADVLGGTNHVRLMSYSTAGGAAIGAAGMAVDTAMSVQFSGTFFI